MHANTFVHTLPLVAVIIALFNQIQAFDPRELKSFKLDSDQATELANAAADYLLNRNLQTTPGSQNWALINNYFSGGSLPTYIGTNPGPCPWYMVRATLSFVACAHPNLLGRAM